MSAHVENPLSALIELSDLLAVKAMQIEVDLLGGGTLSNEDGMDLCRGILDLAQLVGTTMRTLLVMIDAGRSEGEQP